MGGSAVREDDGARQAEPSGRLGAGLDSVARGLRRAGERVSDAPFRICRERGSWQLRYGSVVESVIPDKVYTGHYYDYFLPLAHVFDNPRVLVLGLGGGTIPLQMERLLEGRVEIDAVEISARAAELARLLAPEMKANVIVGEGAEYVAGTDRKYDIIVHDAYRGYRMPSQFFGEKFVGDAERALGPEGLLAIHYGPTWRNRMMLPGYLARLKSRFAVCQVDVFAEDDRILLCSKGLGMDEIERRIEAKMPADPKGLAKHYFPRREYGRMARL
jgi:hypothetical protein